MQKKYILFDNDGVLVETETFYYKASKRALKEFFDVDVSFKQYMKLMTDGKGVWLAAPKASQKEIKIAREKRDEYYQEYLLTQDLTILGVKDTLKELSKRYKMAIVTTSRRVDFNIIHKNRGIVDYMDFVLCVEDYSKAKPDPEPYLKALKLFGAKKDEAIIVEDSQRGLISANRAEIECVIVHNTFTKTQDFSKATYKISKLEKIFKILK